MDDLLADVDGSAEGVERNLNDVDGANDAGAEATGLEEENAFGRLGLDGQDVGDRGLR